MKKTMALVLAVVLLLTMSAPTLAFELDSVETAVEFAEPLAEEEGVQSQDDVDLAATETVAPGINIATGTNKLATFDDEAQKNNFSQENYGSISIVEDPVSIVDGLTPIDPNGTYGKVLQYHRDPVENHWSNVIFNHPLDATRQYYFTWDTFINMDGIKTLWGAVTYIGGSNKHQDVTTKANEWFKTAFSYTPNNDYNFTFRHRVGTVAGAEDAAAANPLNTYIDNFGIYPYYKITYVDGAGETIETLQVLRGEDGEFLREYTVKSDNYPEWDVKDGTVRECIGWAVTPGAADEVTEVALENADITLYPVWKTTEYLTASAESINASAGKSITVTATDPVDWTYDVGATEATVTGMTETSITFNAVGYAGEIDVTATLKSSPEVSVKKTLKFYAGPLFKPGLNIYTGTTEAYGFEEENWHDTAVAKDQNTDRIANPEKNGINSSDYVMNFTQQFKVIHSKVDLEPKIEVERPVWVSFDYRAGGPGYTEPANTIYFMLNDIAGGENGNIYRAMALCNDGVWENKTFTMDLMAGGHESKNLVQTITKDGGVKWLGIESKEGIDGTNKFLNVDNVNMIPYYKVTYMNLDGSDVAATEYVLLDSEGDFLSGYTPDISKVPGATGFALEQGGESVAVVPLENKDIVLYPVTTRQISFKSDVSSKTEVIKDGEGYTFKAPADFGFATENFLVWYAEGVGKYKPGDVLSAERIDEIVGTTFVAYYQDVNVPAMGFAFEGTSKQNGQQKLSYSELIEDDGRSVLHLNQYQSTYEAANPAENKDPKWMTDMRIHIKNANTKFDPKEYNIVQYMYKVDNMVSLSSGKWSTALEDLKPEDLVEHTQAELIIYYYTGEAGDAYYNPGGEHRVGDILKVYDNGKYNMIEVDMSDPANGNSTAPWTYGEFVYGFAVDPNRVNYSGDTYIDYLRVYRDGIFTVTYDTNAPEYYDELVLKNVAPDTGRGVGTGYLLKGERPEIEGYIFRGWALTPDATADEVVDSVDLKGDLTVYAVWEAALYNTAPDMENFAGIRSGADKVNGIRFRSVIDANTKAFMDEYGFIVARQDVLGDKELTFEFKKEGTGTPLYVTGVAYNKDEGKDIQYSVESNGDTVFTAVCVGIPKDHFSTELVARAYAKYSNKNGLAFTVYGSPITRSIAQVAEAVRDANGEDYANNQEYIDYILETVGAQS